MKVGDELYGLGTIKGVRDLGDGHREFLVQTQEEAMAGIDPRTISLSQVAWEEFRKQYGRGILSWSLLPGTYKQAFAASLNVAIAEGRGQ